MANSNFPREITGPAVGLLLGLLLLLGAALLPHRADSGGATTERWAAHHPPTRQTLSLEVGRAGVWALRLKRTRALREGVLITEEDDWVPATLKEGEQIWPVKVRLKGDWTDHLRRGKWSFRVKVRRDSAYRSMTVFSLQNPKTRDFLSEWLFHQVLRQEGILSPRYDFVRLSFNGSDLGVYALEEHFTRQMVEFQSRRAGIPLKFSESGMWEARREALRDPLFPYLESPFYEAAQAEAFQTQRYLGDDSLEAQLRAGLTLMHQYKHGLRPPGEIFDLEQVARQYALTDLFRGHHSLIWHNRRFVYNPLIVRLEPVVFDAFAGEISGLYLNGPFTGYAANGRTSYGRREDLLGTGYFSDPHFVEAYYRYLWRYSDPEFLRDLERRYREAWTERERFLRREFWGYRYDFTEVERQARVMRTALETFSGEQVTIQQVGDSLLCLQNYAPLAVQAKVIGADSTAGPWQLLGAYDGIAGAEWVEVPGSANCSIHLRVAGAPQATVIRGIEGPLTGR
ncbi:MAG: hypothetical protein AAGN35_02015 [Bacteroidota bacterium]